MSSDLPNTNEEGTVSIVRQRTSDAGLYAMVSSSAIDASDAQSPEAGDISAHSAMGSQTPQSHIDHQPANIVNLANSSNVVIGPMTQYQGAVTIYQSMDPPRRDVSSIVGSVEPVRTEATNHQEHNATPPKKYARITTLRRWAIITLIVILVGIAIGVLVVLQLYNLTPINKKVINPKIRFSHQYDADTIPTLSNGHLIIDRHQWGAGPSKVAFVAARLLHPIPHVIVTHIGYGSKPCNNVYNCSTKMRTIQDAAIAKKGLDDMKANFYVSNDGYLYVARGWEIQNVYTARSIAICFMGDYSRNEPTHEQLDAVQFLLEFGITHKNLRADYQLVAQNQTKDTLSPGVNVYKHIVQWPHWHSGCGVGELPLCNW